MEKLSSKIFDTFKKNEVAELNRIKGGQTWVTWIGSNGTYEYGTCNGDYCESWLTDVDLTDFL